MLELIAGVIVAFAALVLVLEPLLSTELALPGTPPRDAEPDFTSIEESDSPKIRALLALKEIEFDRATGKLSDEDYAGLKARYSAEAVQAMKREEAAGAAAGSPGAAALDTVERAVQAARQAGTLVCAGCGPRPERAAAYCSACGRSLVEATSAPRCWRCGAELRSEAKYCASCGNAVAA